MVGKPNISVDQEQQKESKGAAMTTPGLGALDEEREASMADEGGASGAVMETQDRAEFNERLSFIDPRVRESQNQVGRDEGDESLSTSSVGSPGLFIGLGLGLIGGIAAGYYFSRRRAS
jgi:hypothetical protein